MDQGERGPSPAHNAVKRNLSREQKKDMEIQSTEAMTNSGRVIERQKGGGILKTSKQMAKRILTRWERTY